MRTVFFTGFPGFLGSELLPRVLARADDLNAVCLVQSQYKVHASSRMAEIEARYPATRGRIRLIDGDITRPGLGVTDGPRLRSQIVEIYHLAAVYDLSVPRDFAMRVNVDGTRHTLDFAAACPSLDRFQYVSTCYVSGVYNGVFHEADLELGQRFNNFYEETKHLAEVEVRRDMANGIPATIYRPSIVVGDSTTGETQKYDGPYFAMRFMLRQPKIAMMPISPAARRTQFNVVPRDFVVAAIAYLAGSPISLGKTYNLADPHPLTFDGLLGALAHATGRHLIRVPLSLGAVQWSLDHVPGMERLIRIPSSAIDYQMHPTRYDTTTATADLQKSGVTCPPFTSYVDTLVRYVRQHPTIGSAAMV